VRQAKTSALAEVRDARTEREYALVDLRIADAANDIGRQLGSLTPGTLQRRLVEGLDHQQSGKKAFALPHAFFNRRYGRPSLIRRADLNGDHSIATDYGIRQPSRILRESLDPERRNGGALASAGCLLPE
jgi:hypothetical protein